MKYAVLQRKKLLLHLVGNQDDVSYSSKLQWMPDHEVVFALALRGARDPHFPGTTSGVC